jgi:hypothetical protein
MKHESGMLIASWGSKPYVQAIMKDLADAFPFIIFKMGGYNVRTVRGKSIPSLHSYGRAIDIYLDTQYPQERTLGELLYTMFKVNAASLKTNHVIFNWKEWYVGDTADKAITSEDSRGPHTNHVHVDFIDEGMNGTPAGLVGLLQQVSTQLASAGYKDWIDGKYGTAFHPLNNNSRLTTAQRKTLYNLNTNRTTMDISPANMKLIKDMTALHGKVYSKD